MKEHDMNTWIHEWAIIWIHEWENEQDMSTRMTDKYDMHDMTKEKCIWYDVWIWQ